MGARHGHRHAPAPTRLLQAGRKVVTAAHDAVRVGQSAPDCSGRHGCRRAALGDRARRATPFPMRARRREAGGQVRANATSLKNTGPIRPGRCPCLWKYELRSLRPSHGRRSPRPCSGDVRRPRKRFGLQREPPVGVSGTTTFLPPMAGPSMRRFGALILRGLTHVNVQIQAAAAATSRSRRGRHFDQAADGRTRPRSLHPESSMTW